MTGVGSSATASLSSAPSPQNPAGSSGTRAKSCLRSVLRDRVSQSGLHLSRHLSRPPIFPLPVWNLLETTLWKHSPARTSHARAPGKNSSRYQGTQPHSSAPVSHPHSRAQLASEYWGRTLIATSLGK